jgi:hypothetical protein
MPIDRSHSGPPLGNRLTVVSYPAEIVACLLPELNSDRDQLHRMPVIQTPPNQVGNNPGTPKVAIVQPS